MSDPTLTEAEKKFLAYDWSKSQEWQTYFSNLYPTPDASKVPKFKRTWFRRNVDSTLSEESTVGDTAAPKPESAPTASSTTSKPAPSSTTSATPGFSKSFLDRFASRTNLPLAKEFLLRLEFVLLVGFVLAGFAVVTAKFKPSNSETLFKNCLLVSRSFFLMYLVLALLRQQGLPKFNAAYLASLFNNSHVHYFVYGLAFVSTPPKFVYFVPQVLTALLALNDMYKSYPSVFPRLLRYQKAKEVLGLLDTNQYLLYKARGNFEVALVPYLVLTTLFNRTNILPLFIYLNFLRMKVNAKDTYVMNTLKNVHMTLWNYLNHPRVPAVVRNVYQKVVQGLELYFTGRRR